MFDDFKKEDFIRICTNDNVPNRKTVCRQFIGDVLYGLQSDCLYHVPVLINKNNIKLPTKKETIKQFKAICRNKMVSRVTPGEGGIAVSTKDVILGDVNLGRFRIYLRPNCVSVSSECNLLHPHIREEQFCHPTLLMAIPYLLSEFKYSTVIDLCLQTLFNISPEYNIWDKLSSKETSNYNESFRNSYSYAKKIIGSMVRMQQRVFLLSESTHLYKDKYGKQESLISELKKYLHEYVHGFDPILPEILSIEYDRLQQRKDVSIKVYNSSHISIQMEKDLVINGHLIGRPTVFINVENGHITVENSTSPAMKRPNGIVPIHPHIHPMSHVPCLGNIGATLKRAVCQRKLSISIDLLLNFLHSYNSQSPYCMLEFWPKVSQLSSQPK